MLMKPKTTSTLWLAVVALAMGSLCLIGTVRAQNENQRTDTSIADNPHLRRSSSTSSSSSAKLSEKDKRFLVDAASGGQTQVALGKMAENLGNSAAVKNIGARLVADHSKVTKEVVELAKRKGLAINTTPPKMRDIDRAGFDGQFLYTVEKRQDMDIKAFQAEAGSGDDADIKSWAAKTLPTLKSHLAMVKDAKKKIK